MIFDLRVPKGQIFGKIILVKCKKNLKILKSIGDQHLLNYFPQHSP